MDEPFLGTYGEDSAIMQGSARATSGAAQSSHPPRGPSHGHSERAGPLRPDAHLQQSGGGGSLVIRQHLPMVVHSGSHCASLCCPALIALLSLLLVAAGVIWLIPQGVLPLPTSNLGPPANAWLPRGAAVLLGLGLLLIPVYLRLALCCAAPDSDSAKRQDFFGDALTEECLSGNNILEHYDVGGAHNAEAGTIVFIAGASAPRHIMWPLARVAAQKYKVLVVDVPGQGSLVNVPFSLPRAHQVLTRVVERESKAGGSVPYGHSTSTVSLSSVGGGAGGGGTPLLRAGLVAWGAAGFIAMHTALREPSRWGGLAVLGPMPDYIGRFSCSGNNMEQLLALPWVARLSARALAEGVNRQLMGLSLSPSLASRPPGARDIEPAPVVAPLPSVASPPSVQRAGAGRGVLHLSMEGPGVPPSSSSHARAPRRLQVSNLPSARGGGRAPGRQGVAAFRGAGSEVSGGGTRPAPPRHGAVVSVLQVDAQGLPILDHFNVGVVPVMRAELRGLNLFSRLREFPRPVTFLGPRAWIAEATEAAPIRTVTTLTQRDAQDEVLPPQSARAVEEMAHLIMRVAAGWALHRPMPLTEAREVFKVSRSSFLSHASFASWA